MESKLSHMYYSPVSENLEKLAALFPAAVKDGQLDVAALKEELGQFEAVNGEKYELTWPGKKEAKRLALTDEDVAEKTLKYCHGEGLDESRTENLYIEGDNLEVLKLLRNSYYGQIKMIYIDPPYNTGSDLVYRDKFVSSEVEIAKAEGEIDEYGKRLIINQKSSAMYHSTWMNMMYPRIRIALDLLRDDGIIFASIDDNELNNLQKIFNDVFGEENFIGLFVINSSPSAIDYGNIAKMHDYIVFYAKNIFQTTTYQLPDHNKEFKYNDETGNFNLYPLYNGNVAFNPVTRPNLYYPFYLNPMNKIDGDFYEIGLEKKEGWIEVYPVISRKDGIQRVWRWGKEKARSQVNREIVGYKAESGEFRIVQKTRLTGKVIRSLQLDAEISSRRGTGEVEDLFKRKIFSFPKSVELIRRLSCIACGMDDIVIDFFSGSATTAHAVMQLNAEDGGNRKYIMVQIPEPTPEDSEARKSGYSTISDIGKERIRRASAKIRKELEEKRTGQASLNDDEPIDPDTLDLGFKVFKVGPSNIRWNAGDFEALMIGQAEIKLGVNQLGMDDILTEKDLLDFQPGTKDIDVVYEVLLRHRDFPLSSKVEKLETIGTRTWMFADAVVVCLENEVTNKIVDDIAALTPKPLKVIFRDSAFGDDVSLKLNAMNRLTAQLQHFHGGEDKAFRVEFI